MKYFLKITDEAADLLFSAAKWYAETSQSLEVASAWYDGFLDELELLEDNPLRGSLAPEGHLFDFELREVYYGSGRRVTHRALYRIAGNTVEVLSIPYHAQRPLRSGDL
jgi:plasmid stabilization system protein ParE